VTTSQNAVQTRSQRLADFVSSLQPDDLPAHVRQDAIWRLMDTVGVSLVGSRMDYAQPIQKVFSEMGGRGESTVIGGGERLPAAATGFVNAAYAHGPDFDDTHSVAMVHIGCLAVPSALAMAERTGATGAQMLTALVAGAEVGLRIGAAAPHRFHMRGFHATGVVGPFTAAATAGKLLGLDAVRLASGLGLAGSQAAGLLQGLHDGSWVKRLHPGWAVQGGITAALLAEQGYLGPPQVLEGGWALYAVLLHGDSEPVDLDVLTDGLGTTWLLPETTYKPYSNGAWNHSAMDGVAAILAAETLTYKDIARVDVTVPPECIPVVCEPRDAKIRPVTPYHMKFSLPYSVAILAVLGHAGVDDYTAEVHADPDIADLASRVYCDADPAMAPDRFPAKVRLETRDGRHFSYDIPAQRGGPGNPFSADDHRAKFLSNASPSIGTPQAQQLMRAIETVWEMESIGDLLRLAVG